MSTIEELIRRKSVRQFEDKLIDKETKTAILNAAVNAPSAGNQQLWTIIDVTDKELQKKLSVACDNQPFIAEGGMVLVFLADCKKWYDAYLNVGCNPRKPGVGDLLLAVSDANIAAQNAVVAAESLGIGSCYIGDVMENAETMRDLLKLPEYVFPAALLVFGYPTEQQKNRVKPNRPRLDYVVRENYYDITPEFTKETLVEKQKLDNYEEWVTNFCNRKYNSDFSKEMSRSVKTYLNQFEK